MHGLSAVAEPASGTASGPEGQDGLARQVERAPARDEDRDGLAGVEQLVDRIGRVVDDVLAVVDHQQHVAIDRARNRASKSA